MSIYTIKSETLTGIADAIRSKTGGSSPIYTEDMASEISNIPSGGSTVHFTVTLTGPRAMYYDYVTSVYTFLSDIEGSLSISVTGITDCGNNDAYISFELNGTEVSRGTLVTDTSTTISFPDTSIAVGDTVALNFGWVGNHGAEFNGSADIIIDCGSSDKKFDVLIDWALYSHVAAFDSISIPANYTDYDHLALAAIQDNVDQDYMKHMLNAYLQSYVDTGFSNGTLTIIDTADITSTPTLFALSINSGSTIGRSIDGWSYISSQEILGYQYSWPWQNLYLICFGFND